MLTTKTLAKHVLTANTKYNMLKIWKNPLFIKKHKIIKHDNLFNVIIDSQVIDNQFSYNYTYYEGNNKNSLVENEYRMRLHLTYKNNKYYENFVHFLSNYEINDFEKIPIIYNLRNKNKNLQSIDEIDKRILEMIHFYGKLNFVENKLMEYNFYETNDKLKELKNLNKELEKLYLDNVIHIINIFGFNSILYNRYNNLYKSITNL
jgi:hypothetical protein